MAFNILLKQNGSLFLKKMNPRMRMSADFILFYK
jgi:hypothetical protein